MKKKLKLLLLLIIFQQCTINEDKCNCTKSLIDTNYNNPVDLIVASQEQYIGDCSEDNTIIREGREQFWIRCE